jgi:hypothetical protein
METEERLRVFAAIRMNVYVLVCGYKAAHQSAILHSTPVILLLSREHWYPALFAAFAIKNVNYQLVLPGVVDIRHHSASQC